MDVQIPKTWTYSEYEDDDLKSFLNCLATVQDIYDNNNKWFCQCKKHTIHYNDVNSDSILRFFKYMGVHANFHGFDVQDFCVEVDSRTTKVYCTIIHKFYDWDTNKVCTAAFYRVGTSRRNPNEEYNLRQGFEKAFNRMMHKVFGILTMPQQPARKVLAVDFDNTLFSTRYPEIIAPIWSVINYVKWRKSHGWVIILNSCRHTQEDLQSALNACAQVGIEFDFVNENCPEQIIKYGESRKIWCNELLDDTCIHTIPEIVNSFDWVSDMMRSNNGTN